MKRVLVRSETLAGRIHAAWGVQDDQDRILAPKRTAQALCGVPVNRTPHLFVLDSDARTCKNCNKQASSIIEEGK